MTGSSVPKRSVLADAVASAISCHFSPRFILPLLSCAVPSLVFASPEGGQVVAGTATISNPDTNTTLITQTTTHTAIDWQRFNIGTQEYVQFVQPDANSVALNRVIGGDPSQILGNLSANGQVFLVNPNGVYFGQSATVDVGGIVASVQNIRNEDFLSGNYVFSKSSSDSSDAGVVNDGVITARDGGYVVLMGDYVHNNGIINARMGTVALASGSQITMDVKSNGLISVAVDEASLSDMAGVKNAGEIMAAGGRVMMTAKVASDLIDTAINNEGLVVANSIAERNGVIFLTAAGGD
ncbi:MAG: filamentous hemagglutinin N-terminal domain-containing protein, partial [Gammaproteobacteria bacterium]|nr:filamentous hemagglutinin N-terminal domain-containing protein [Gammaproteobacteria bacterium]